MQENIASIPNLLKLLNFVYTNWNSDTQTAMLTDRPDNLAVHVLVQSKNKVQQAKVLIIGSCSEGGSKSVSSYVCGWVGGEVHV